MDVQHLYVVPKARGTGVGRALMDACGEVARAQRCDAVTLGVMAKNTNAQAFYSAIGFVPAEASGAIQLLLRLAS